VADRRAALRREAEKLRSSSPLDRLIAAWLVPSTFADEAGPAVVAALAQWREANQGRASRSSKSVSALAMAIALNLADAEGRQASSRVSTGHWERHPSSRDLP